MSLDFGEEVDKTRIRVLSENSIGASLRTDEKFKDKVQQAGLSAYCCAAAFNNSGIYVLIDYREAES